MRRLVVRARRLASQTRSRASERGQVIVLFALFLVALLGIGAFVLDVARVYALQRYERSVADAAALAGAQDLQDSTNSRALTPSTAYPKAVADALSLLESQLGGAASCATTTTSSPYSLYENCTVGQYSVSIKVPSPSYANVDPTRAVQVTVQQKSVPMTLARLFGQNNWNVGQTSVAGLRFASQWAVETLRPPLPKGPNDQNAQDVNSNGTNTTLTVVNGDIGTNTNAVTNSGGTIILAAPPPADPTQNATGYYIWHFDPGIGWNQTGTPALPAGMLLSQLLPDPQYTIPTSTGPTYSPWRAGVDANCSRGSPPSTGTWTCLRPGVYPDAIHFSSSYNVYLEPGLYYFTGGLQVDGQLVGGNQGPASGTKCTATAWTDCTGVTLVFPSSSYFKGNNALLITLNGGTNGDCAVNANDCPTAPQMVTLGTGKTPLIVPLTLAVNYVPGAQSVGGTLGTCFDGTTPLNTCTSSSVIQLPGNGNLNVGGVTYAPTDDVQINGNNTTSTGLVGQLIAWNIAYSGGAHVQQYYPGSGGNGILTLDAACSGPIGFGFGGVGSGSPNFCNP